MNMYVKNFYDKFLSIIQSIKIQNMKAKKNYKKNPGAVKR